MNIKKYQEIVSLFLQSDESLAKLIGISWKTIKRIKNQKWYIISNKIKSKLENFIISRWKEFHSIIKMIDSNIE